MHVGHVRLFRRNDDKVSVDRRAFGKFFHDQEAVTLRRARIVAHDRAFHKSEYGRIEVARASRSRGQRSRRVRGKRLFGREFQFEPFRQINEIVVRRGVRSVCVLAEHKGVLQLEENKSGEISVRIPVFRSEIPLILFRSVIICQRHHARRAFRRHADASVAVFIVFDLVDLLVRHRRRTGQAHFGKRCVRGRKRHAHTHARFIDVSAVNNTRKRIFFHRASLFETVFDPRQRCDVPFRTLGVQGVLIDERIGISGYAHAAVCDQRVDSVQQNRAFRRITVYIQISAPRHAFIRRAVRRRSAAFRQAENVHEITALFGVQRSRGNAYVDIKIVADFTCRNDHLQTEFSPVFGEYVIVQVFVLLVRVVPSVIFAVLRRQKIDFANDGIVPVVPVGLPFHRLPAAEYRAEPRRQAGSIGKVRIDGYRSRNVVRRAAR